MSSLEFQLIDQFFKSENHRADVRVGIGDDAAVLTVQQNAELVWSVDSLVKGVHFNQHDPAQSVGHRALAVNLSDLAAMGADPCWSSLALTLPSVDKTWLQGFCQGYFDLAQHYGVELIGGDTTQGPLSMTVNIAGWVPKGEAILRQGAKPGDLIFLSGEIGSAGMALQILAQQKSLDEFSDLAKAYYWPQPRVELGMALRGIASAAIDISDGLAADLGHILQVNAVGASVRLADIPLSAVIANHVKVNNDWTLPLTAGDDYELCFTVPKERLTKFKTQTHSLALNLQCIGQIISEPELRFVAEDNSFYQLKSPSGYQHFRS